MTQIQTLFLYAGFNNYYNRKVKRFDTLDEYPEPLTAISGTNFQFNDGITAEIVCNLANHLFSDEPDYVVAEDDKTDNLSRWFIMDIKRERNGQSRITLRRDVVADFYNTILDAPCFIEKATLGLNNNLIFNSEAMTYNQIKQGEYPLMDRTRCPWIVGYIPRNIPNTGGEEPEPTDKTIEGPSNTVRIDGEFASWDVYDYNNYFGGTFEGEFADVVFAMGVRYITGSVVYSWDENGNPKTPNKLPNGWQITNPIAEGLITTYDLPGGWVQSGGYSVSSAFSKLGQIIEKTRQFSNWEEMAYNYCDAHNEYNTNLFKQEDGKIYKVGDKFYQISISPAGYMTVPKWSYNVSPQSQLGTQFVAAANEADLNTTNINGYPCNIIYRANLYRITRQEVSGDTVKVDIKADRPHLIDAPYDMFCIPYGKIIIDELEYNDPVAMLSVASAIYTQLGGNVGVYDLQLLPYCPLDTRAITEEGNITLELLDQKSYASITNPVGTILGLLFWCERSNFTTQLIDPEIPALPTDSVEFKVRHETEFYRMVSPNYNGTFEIKQTSNRGLSGFTATCSYRPFTPYIKVAPTFSGLYGANYGDARGLICGGDFSLPVMSSAWENYQIQNKNYQVMFDRQIENMEFNNNIAKWQGILGAATSAVSAGVMGGAVGGLGLGLGLGAGSAVAGAIDVGILMAQQKETLDFTKDNFGYQLGNIKAQPQSLTKVSSFNADNKTFPFLEFYTCSAVEKEALRKKLKYNGMTTMAVGTIREHLQPQESYIKGQLIRLEDEGMDYHILLELATEINKGVFIV